MMDTCFDEHPMYVIYTFDLPPAAKN